MQRYHLWRQIGRVLFSAALAAFALLSAAGTFGWFAESRDVTAGGMLIQSAESGILEIRADVKGDNIGVSAPEDIEQTLTSAIKELHPDVSGSFTFYVHSDTAPYRFRYGVSIQNNAFHKGEGFPEGFYPYVKDEEKAQALQYIRSHLLFFTHKQGDVYSGWIQPDVTVPQSVEAEKNPYEVTVYWVWIGDHRKIFDAESGLIEESTRQRIANYYGSHPDQMFVGDEKTAEAYNGADTLIGIVLKYICFQVTVSKE